MEVECTTIDVRSRRTRSVGKNKGNVYCYQQTLYRVSFPSITYSLFFKFFTQPNHHHFIISHVANQILGSVVCSSCYGKVELLFRLFQLSSDWVQVQMVHDLCSLNL